MFCGDKFLFDTGHLINPNRGVFLHHELIHQMKLRAATVVVELLEHSFSLSLINVTMQFVFHHVKIYLSCKRFKFVPSCKAS